MMQTVTSLYAQRLKEHHASTKWGVTVATKISHIDIFAEENNVRSILDYGCGQGILKEKLGHKYEITEYDAGISGKDILPSEVYDMIVCVDVAEHFEPDTVASNFKAMHDRVAKCVYMTISCEPAIGCFADGTNLHLTIKPPWEWMQIIDAEFQPKKLNFYGTDRGLLVKLQCGSKADGNVQSCVD